MSRYIVDVMSKSKRQRCQILVDSRDEAARVKRRVLAEGIWEARNGVRYQFMAAASVGHVRIVLPPASNAPAAGEGRE